MSSVLSLALMYACAVSSGMQGARYVPDVCAFPVHIQAGGAH